MRKTRLTPAIKSSLSQIFSQNEPRICLSHRVGLMRGVGGHCELRRHLQQDERHRRDVLLPGLFEKVVFIVVLSVVGENG